MAVLAPLLRRPHVAGAAVIEALNGFGLGDGRRGVDVVRSRRRRGDRPWLGARVERVRRLGSGGARDGEQSGDRGDVEREHHQRVGAHAGDASPRAK